MVGRLREILSHLSPSERRILGFLVGWALLGAVAARLPWTATLSEPAPVVFPRDDPRALLHARSAALAAHLAVARTLPAEPVDPNLASREELDRLPGVGPKTALRWIAEREAGARFLPFPTSDACGVWGPRVWRRWPATCAFRRPREPGGRPTPRPST